MKANYRAAASAGLLLSAACADLGQAATTVQTTVGPQAASSNFDLLFSTPLTNVEQLVSISDGSVSTGEGGAMTISAILPDDSLVLLFSKTSFFENIALSTLTGNIFSSFSTPQTVKGLQFKYVGSSGPQGTFTIPASTVLTFTAVPEPATAVVTLLGGVFVAIRRRRVAF